MLALQYRAALLHFSLPTAKHVFELIQHPIAPTLRQVEAPVIQHRAAAVAEVGAALAAYHMVTRLALLDHDAAL